MKLYQVRVLTGDLAQTFSFCPETQGLPVVWGSVDGLNASFGASGLVGIAICDRVGMSGAPPHLEMSPHEAEVGSSFIIVPQVDSVDRAYGQLPHEGIRFDNEPRDCPGWTIRTVHLRVPDGTLVELFTTITTTIDIYRHVAEA